MQISANIFVAFEAEGCDGPGSARGVELKIENGAIVSAAMHEPGTRWTYHAVPLRLFRYCIITDEKWEAFELDAVRLARRQSFDPAMIAFRAEEAQNDRADEANDLARAP